MRCWYCQESLIYGGDDMLEDDEQGGEYLVTTLSCPKCEAEVLITVPAHQTTTEI